MAALDNIASELLKAANVADLNFKKTRDQAERDKAVRLRRIVENLKAISAGGLTPNLDEVLTEGNTSTNTLDVGGITTDYVQLDTAATPTLAVGMTRWNASLGVPETRLGGGNVTGQHFLEGFVVAINKTGATLNESEFRAVRIRSVAEGGAQGQRLAVVLAQADSDANSATTIGIVTETVPNNQQGLFTTTGDVNEINTTGAMSWGGSETWVDGDILYLSPDHAGYLTKVKPIAPNRIIVVGWVVYAHAIHGKIFVKVDNGYELDELHNVRITSVANNDLLQYDSTLQVWKNVSASVAVPTPTLAQVTTAGNTTTNAITVGNITVNSSTNELKIFDVTGGNYTRIKDRKISFSRNSGTSESVSIYSPDNQLWLMARSGIYVYSGSNPGETYFFARDYSGTNRIQVKDTGAVILQESNNNVLIGTTTDAGYKLDVNGTGRFTNELTVGGVSLNLSAQGTGLISSGNSVGGATTYITMRGPVYYNPTSGVAGTFAVTGQSYMSSGTAQFNTLTVGPTINNTGTYSGIFRGFYYNPTLTSLTGTTHRGAEIASGDFIWGNGYSQHYGNSIEGFVQFQSSGNSTKIWIRPSGNQAGFNSSYWGYLENSGYTTTLKSGNYHDLSLSGESIRFKNNNLNEVARFAVNTGNLLIGTTTDAGYKLDVNGTARVQGAVVFSNSSISNLISVQSSTSTSFIWQGNNTSLAYQQNNLNIQPSTGSLGVHISNYDGTTILYAKASSTGDIAVGIGTMSPLAKFHVTGSKTAASALAQGVFFNNTLVAAANNDVLVGLDINPTFTLGGFSGTQRYGLRVQNSPILINGTYNSLSSEGINPDSLININATIVGRGGSRAIAMRLAPTINANSVGSQTFAALEINPTYQNVGAGSNAYSLNSIGTNYVGPINVFGWNTIWQQQGGTSTYHTIGAPNGQGFRVQVNSNIAGYSFEFNGSGIPTYTLRNNNIDAVKVYSTGNVGVATTTDTGYKLDVNGTARIQGVITGSVGGGAITLGAAAANQPAISINGYFTSGGAIITSNANARSFNSVIGGQNYGVILSYSSNAQGQTTSSYYFAAGGNINLTDGAIDLHGFAFTPTIVSETGATIKAFTSALSAASNHYNLYLSGTAQNYLAGNVGIGTTSPQAKLDVEGDFRIGVGFQLRFNNANVGAYRDSNDLRLAGYNSIQFLSSATAMSSQVERMRILNNGNVLVGTTTDTGEKLQVNGSIKSSALTLNGPVLATGGVLSSIAGYTGLFTVPTNPPGMQTLDIQNGIIVNVL